MWKRVFSVKWRYFKLLNCVQINSGLPVLWENMKYLIIFYFFVLFYMNINNKLFQNQPTLGKWRPAFRASRREQVVISPLRIGHTRLTHAFILKQEPQPQYLTCQTTRTVKHTLIECRPFAVIRKRFFKVTSLTELFENIKIDDVLSFLRETGLYEKIWWIKTN